jgi:hypothetical protein
VTITASLWEITATAKSLGLSVFLACPRVGETVYILDGHWSGFQVVEIDHYPVVGQTVPDNPEPQIIVFVKRIEHLNLDLRLTPHDVIGANPILPRVG